MGDHAHEHLVRKYGVEVPPWPFVKQRQAARMLGVSVTYLDGMANNPIPAVKLLTPKGNTIWAFNRDVVFDLAEKLRGVSRGSVAG